MLKRLIQSARPRPAEPSASIPPGKRVYAIGDIHGRLDLFDALLARIDEDSREAPSVESELLLLGDLVDRGPESAGVVARAMELVERGARCLFGNHEELFLAALEGSESAMRTFVRVGGRETLLSYGLSMEAYNEASFEELIELTQKAVPAAHVEFIRSLPHMIEIGDYLFVHAGVRPGVPLDEQKESDLRWIRGEFLNYRKEFGKIVVHGHSISPEVEQRVNRIGIDTGAFDSGRLTAVVLEENRRRFLQTEEIGADADMSIAVNAL